MKKMVEEAPASTLRHSLERWAELSSQSTEGLVCGSWAQAFAPQDLSFNNKPTDGTWMQGRGRSEQAAGRPAEVLRVAV